MATVKRGILLVLLDGPGSGADSVLWLAFGPGRTKRRPSSRRLSTIDQTSVGPGLDVLADCADHTRVRCFINIDADVLSRNTMRANRLMKSLGRPDSLHRDRLPRRRRAEIILALVRPKPDGVFGGQCSEHSFSAFRTGVGRFVTHTWCPEYLGQLFDELANRGCWR